MIYEAFSPNQWLSLTLVGFLVSSAVWEIILYRIKPYDYRDAYDPPPVLGGMLVGLVTLLVTHAILGSIQGIVWLWNN